jgi:hypothetical protein
MQRHKDKKIKLNLQQKFKPRNILYDGGWENNFCDLIMIGYIFFSSRLFLKNRCSVLLKTRMTDWVFKFF